MIAFDFLRGMAILGILFVHRMHYSWSVMNSKESIRQNFHGANAIFIVVAIALFTMAGLFYLISGAVNVCSIYNRIRQDQTTARKIIGGGLFTGLWFVFLHLVQRILFMNGFRAVDGQIPEYPVGLLTGRIIYHEWVPFYWKQAVDSSTLSLIGMIVIVVSITTALLFRNGGYRHLRRNQLLLTGLGLIVALISPIALRFLRPVFEQALNSGHYLTAGFVGILASRFGLFPYLSYGFFGAVLGLALAAGVESRQILKYLSRAILIWLLIGLATLAIILLIRNIQVSTKMLFVSSGVVCIELGLFLWFMRFSLRRFDFTPSSKPTNSGGLSVIRRFGLLAMTVYILEPFLAAILTNIIAMFAGQNWQNSFGWIVGLGLLCAICWHFIIKFWSRVNYSGSFEWLYIFLSRKFHIKDSRKLPE